MEPNFKNNTMSKDQLSYLCPLCNENQHCKFIIDVIDYRYRIGRKRQLLRCKNCDCSFTWPVPKNLESQYPANYSPWFDKKNSSGEKKVKTIIKNFLYGVKEFDFTSNSLNYFRKNELKKKLLEIGPGSGKFLDLCNENNWVTHGLDSSESASSLISSKGHRSISWDSIREHGKMDAVVLHHVLEHFHDPTTKIRKLKSIMKDNGDLFIVVPNIDCFLFNWFREYYNQLDGGRHLVMSSKKTLKKLLEDNGFEISRIATFSKASNFYGSYLRKSDKQYVNKYIRVCYFIFFRMFSFIISLIGGGEIIEAVCINKR